MKEEILGDMLHEEGQHVYRGYMQYSVVTPELRGWLRVVSHINSKIDEEDVLGITGVTLFVNYEVLPSGSVDQVKEIFTSFESSGILRARPYDSSEDIEEYYLVLPIPLFLSSKENDPQLTDEVTNLTNQFLEAIGTVDLVVEMINSKSLKTAVKNDDASDSWEQSLGKPNGG